MLLMRLRTNLILKGFAMTSAAPRSYARDSDLSEVSALIMNTGTSSMYLLSTRYSSKQIIVILMDTNTENGDMVAGRILDCFHELYTDGNVQIDYGIARMDSIIHGGRDK